MTTSNAWLPGDVVTLDFPFSSGETAKNRPVLVLAGPTSLGDYTVAMISRSKQDDGVLIAIPDFASGALNADSFVRIRHLFTCESNCIVLKRGALKPGTMKRIIAALCPTLGCKS